MIECKDKFDLTDQMTYSDTSLNLIWYLLLKHRHVKINNLKSKPMRNEVGQPREVCLHCYGNSALTE